MKNEVQEAIKCEMYPDEDATVEITYGLYSEYKGGKPHYNHKLCQRGANELWEKCKPLVNLGDMHWKNKEI